MVGVLRRRQDDSRSGFYLNMFLTLNSNPLIGSKTLTFLITRKGTDVFSKKKKKKDMKTKCGVK